MRAFVRSVCFVVHASVPSQFKRFIATLPVGLLLSVTVVVLVGGRYLRAYSQRPAHRQEIATAYGSAGLVYGVAQSDPSGQRITYSQMSDEGIGMFLHDVGTGQRRLIYQKLPLSDEWRTLDVWPWSPDGRHFTFTHTNLFVCDAESGQPVAELPVEGRNGVAALAWLSPEAFVYVSRQGNVHRFQHRAGRWSAVGSAGMKAGAADLTALSSNAIAWRQGDRVWSLNLDTRAAAVWSAPSEQRLTGFSYFKMTQQLLLTCNSNGVDSLWRLSPGAPPAERLRGIESLASARNAVWLTVPGRPLTPSLSPSDGERVANRSGEAYSGHSDSVAFAYLSPTPNDSERTVLIVQRGSEAEPVKLFAAGKVDAFTASADGKRLFIVGAATNEPSPGIWRYDVESSGLQCVTPYATQPSAHARREPAMHGYVTLPSGRRVDYYLYPPAHFNRREKRSYPLVIGNTLYNTPDPEYQNRSRGPQWAEMLANCGAWVVIVERRTWFGGIDQWTNTVMGVYEQLAADRAVDKQRIYLFATSAETKYMSELVQQHPELWAGAMLLNPSLLPDLAALPSGRPAPRLLISYGSEEQRKTHFERYQENAWKAGVPVDIYEHAGSGHWLLGKTALDERSRAMVDFVFNN